MQETEIHIEQPAVTEVALQAATEPTEVAVKPPELIEVLVENKEQCEININIEEPALREVEVTPVKELIEIVVQPPEVIEVAVETQTTVNSDSGLWNEINW
jgi:hypothetical protein